jgi:hypothetical protein
VVNPQGTVLRPVDGAWRIVVLEESGSAAEAIRSGAAVSF